MRTTDFHSPVDTTDVLALSEIDSVEVSCWDAKLVRVLIIDAHPQAGSYCDALARSYAKGVRNGGYPYRYLALRSLQFSLNARDGELEPDLVAAQRDLLWAEHVVIVFPIWWGAMPALLKGFFDRMLNPGFAFEERGEGGWRGLLSGRSAQLIATMDTQPWIFRWLIGWPGIRAVRDATLKFCGIQPVKVTTLGPIRGSSLPQRRRWLAKIERTGARVQRDFRTGLRAKASAWLAAARLQFYAFPLLAAAAGALAGADARGGILQIGPYLIACAAIALLEFITVVTNEIHDLETDRANRNHGPFTGGSRVLVEGRLTYGEVRQGRVIASLLLACVVLAAFVALPLAMSLSLTMLVGVGLFLGLGYTAPPLQFSYRGLGEMDVALTHSFLVVLMGFVSQGGGLLNVQSWLFALPMFFAVLPAIMLAGLPDRESDRYAGKRTLAVRMGPVRTAYAALSSVFVALALYCFLVSAGGITTLLLAIHATLVAVILSRLILKPHSGRINGSLIATLTYMVWFALGPAILLWRRVW